MVVISSERNTEKAFYPKFYTIYCQPEKRLKRIFLQPNNNFNP